jgi:hypothetical protein
MFLGYRSICNHGTYKNPNKFQVLPFLSKSDGVVILSSTPTLESRIGSLQVDTQMLVLSRTIPSSSTGN